MAQPPLASAPRQVPLEGVLRVGASRRVAAMPLSREALAARTAPPTGERPVIEVTIDRIDVRASAPPPRVARPVRTQAPPSVSLGDYLRGSGRSGGPR